MTRKAKTNFQFSDGTSIPAGTFVSAAAMAVHHDGQLYPDPDEFNPWRFVDQDIEESRRQLVTTNIDYIPFGHGKHAWYCRSAFFS